MFQLGFHREQFYRYLRLLGLALSLVLAAALSGFLAMRYAIRGTVVAVPDLVGATTSDASVSLQRAGLVMKILARKPNPGTPASVVLIQDPIAGTTVKAGQMVRVIVSSGARKDAVPNVVGSSLRVAQITLSRAGHALGDVCRIHYGTENASEIVRQTPSPEDVSVAGATVHVLLNLGAREETYVMPEVVGRDINEAIRFFERSGILIESVTYRGNSGFAKGIILAQQPERGYRLSRHSSLKLEVSR